MREWFRVEARAAEADADSSSAADVYIYDEIGERWYGGGIGARSLTEQLDELDVDTIYVHINSPGGAAWDGVTIMNSLRRQKARIEVIVDGLAASAASVIAMAGDRITMNRGSQLMIHDASGGAWGNATYMEDTAQILHKLSDSIADVYAARAGHDRAHWRALMLAESWYTAEEAVDAGLADEWVDAPATTAEARVPVAKFDPAMFSTAAHANAPRFETPELPSSSEPGDPNRKELPVSDNLTAGLRERLGVTDADASDETLLAALDEALAEQADPITAPPAGTVLVDAAQFAQLQASAQLGVEASQTLAAQRRDALVQAALADGRIAPAAAATWKEQLEKNEASASALLATLPTNTVPVAEIGHSDSTKSADDVMYNAAFGDDEEA